MSDRMREANKSPRPTTVLNPLRPAVVVRRRVYDTTAHEQGAQQAPQAFTSAGQFVEAEEESPPSSINVARALAALRADELDRVEDLVQADDAKDRVVPPPAPAPPAPVTKVPTLRIGKTIPLANLAVRMGVSLQELPAALVARGFYAVDAKTVLSRETARIVAEIYGWKVEDAPDESEPPPPAKSGTRSRISTKARKVGTKPKPKPRTKTKAAAPKAKPKVKVKVKVKAKAKPAKRQLAR